MPYEPSDAKKLFLQAVELTNREDRSAFLDRACRGSAELRARVDQLLQSHENPGSFLGQPAMADPTAGMKNMRARLWESSPVDRFRQSPGIDRGRAAA